MKFGGTTIYDDVSVNIGNNSSRRAWVIEFLLANQGATNAQVLSGTFHIGGAGTPAAGIGDITASSAGAMIFAALPAIDTTVNQTLAVTVILSTASPNFSFRKQWADTRLE